MASDESLPREIISLCVAATYVWTHYCQITHIGLIVVWSHTDRITHKQTATCKSRIFGSKLVNPRWLCDGNVGLQLSDLETVSPARVKTAPQGQKLFLTAAICVSLLIDFLFSVSQGSTSANGAELCNSMQLWAFFSLFPYKSLPVLNLRRLKSSGTPTPAERQESGLFYCQKRKNIVVIKGREQS